MIYTTTQELHVCSPFAFSSVQFGAGGGVLLFSRLSNFNPIHICSRSCIFHQTSAWRFSGYKYMTYHDVSVLERFPISPEVILLFFFPEDEFSFFDFSGI